MSSERPPHDPLPPPPPGVRTTRRRGRSSAAKAATLAQAGQRWMVPAVGPWTRAALVEATGIEGPLLVDIGIGDGTATLDWARQRPDALVLGLELHRPGLATCLAALERDQPPNVRLAEVDALGVLDALPSASVEAVRLLFPDPWPKRRHIKRRMVDRAFASRVAEVLVDGGHLEIATDREEYAEHARTMVATEPRLEPRPAGEHVPRPTTAYEQRGLDAGRQIHDLVVRRRPR